MKILYVTTISNTVNIFLIPHIKMLINQGHQVDVAFNIEQEVQTEIYELGCKVHQLTLQRSPLSKDNLKAYKVLKDIIAIEEYDLVHTHTPVASAIVRLVCRNMSRVKMIYTAHGFHFYKGAPLINWLVYYPIERWLARYTDVLITINKEDYSRAKKSFKAGKVEYIPGVGIDTKKISEININKLKKIKDLGIPEDAYLLSSVGELNKNKNHETVIRALGTLNNPEIHYLICGEGILEEYLKTLIKEFELEQQVHLLGFRKDILEILKISNVFIFPSYREGLSVSLMEAMVSGLPVVCSNIRGNTDLIKDGKGGYLIEPENTKELLNKILILKKDKIKEESMGLYNISRVKDYELKNVLRENDKVYSSLKKKVRRK